MFYIQLGLVALACMYAVPLIVTLIKDTRFNQTWRRPQ